MFKRSGVIVVLLGLSVIVNAGSPAEIIGQVKAQITASDKADSKVKAFATSVILSFSTNPVFIEAIKAQNSKKITLDQIKKQDQEWRDAEDELAIHEELLGNACAQEIVKQIKANPAIAEAFVMDNQGANVGQNDLTSDYWQGDEAKWQNSFNGGKGGADVGKLKFDKSANASLQQVSVPVIDTDGTVVGAICVGVNTSKL